MSNFKGWTTENFEAAQKQMLERQLDKLEKQSVSEARQVFAAIETAKPAKVRVSPILDEFNNMGTPEGLAKAEKRMMKMLKTKKPKGETANAITANVIRAINIQPRCVAYRINNVGIWDQAKQIHRRANTQKGIFDVAAIIKGRAAWFEIKAGYDKPSQDQLIFQQEVIQAGGIAEFVKSTDEFLKLFTKILLDL